MNNNVKNYRGKVVGFRCFQCDEVKDRMWGTTCNSCRNKSDEAAKLRDEIARLTDAVSKLQEQKK